MDEQPSLVIEVDGITKSFMLPHQRSASLKHAFVNLFRPSLNLEKQKVLTDISFSVARGEFLGIVGRNGSGKSTLLKLLAGIYSPDNGILKVRGSLTPFIELGVGFNPELTGRENVYLNGALLGFNRAQMREMYQDIVAFAELKRFMDQKLKNYSSGMQVRLAFSIAIKVNSDILLLDEVLAVGDAAFQRKCFDYFRKLKRDKKTVVFISHNMDAVREYCDRAILIEKGDIVMSGSADKVAQEYTKLFLDSPKIIESSDKSRWGNGQAKINKIDVEQKTGNIIVTIEGKFLEDIEEPVFGINIKSPMGLKLFESNTKWERVKVGSVKKGQKVTVEWKVANIFTNGTQTVTAALSNYDGTDFYDWWDDATSFVTNRDKVTTAVALPDSSVSVKASP